MKNFNGKAIYNPSGKAGEYSYWACNFYVGCSHKCSYCYCKSGIFAHQMGGDTPNLKKCFNDEKHALEVFEKEMLANLSELQKSGLFFTFSSDPMLEKTAFLNMSAMILCVLKGVKVKLLTKDTENTLFTFLDNKEDNILYEQRKLIAVGFTLTGHDELEPGANTNYERIDAMMQLHSAGYRTFASVEPIIDIDSSMLMIDEIVDCCDLIKIGLLSGGKYKRKELREMIETIISYYPNNRFYFKDSLLSKAGFTRDTLPVYDHRILSNCVERDYDIF